MTDSNFRKSLDSKAAYAKALSVKHYERRQPLQPHEKFVGLSTVDEYVQHHTWLVPKNYKLVEKDGQFTELGRAVDAEWTKRGLPAIEVKNADTDSEVCKKWRDILKGEQE